MGHLAEKMLNRIGKTSLDLNSRSRLGKILKRRGVPETKELRRILKLPRREWDELKDLEFLQTELTNWLRTKKGKQELRLIQAAGLREAHDVGGLLAPIGVGGGKTHITRLAPIVMEAKRPILLIPAKLRNKTIFEFEEMDAHWQRHDNLTLVNYELLSRREDLLKELNPDLIMADECYFLKNLGAACTKRVSRWMEEYSQTAFIAMSGTITKRSLRDFHHLLLWALGPKNAPLPKDPREVFAWAMALDAKVELNQRLEPGALWVFAPEGSHRDDVRQGFGDRLLQTPGVVGSTYNAVDASILLDYWDPEPPVEITDLANEIARTMVGPNGDIITDPNDLWRHVRELVCGFYYEWDPEPPEDWMDARRRWRSYVRKILMDDISGLDTELQVANACHHKKLDSNGAYEDWTAIKGSFKPNSVARWVNTQTLEALVEKIQGDELIWIEHVAVGKKLAEMTKLPFFHRGGVDAKKRPIEKLKGGAAILSIGSNAEGRNLQAWSKNIIVTPPPNGHLWEQLLGRTHREGQLADFVSALILLGHPTLHNCMTHAFEDARYIQSVTRVPQKLLIADSTQIFRKIKTTTTTKTKVKKAA